MKTKAQRRTRSERRVIRRRLRGALRMAKRSGWTTAMRYWDLINMNRS